MLEDQFRIEIERDLKRGFKEWQKQQERERPWWERELDRMDKEFRRQELEDWLDRLKQQQEQDFKDSQDNLKRQIEDDFQRMLDELNRPKPRKTPPPMP